jgi:hypothetical protein
MQALDGFELGKEVHELVGRVTCMSHNVFHTEVITRKSCTKSLE